MVNFFSPPKGYAPADSMTLGIATAGGVFMIYGAKIGPCADVQMTQPGDPSVNSSIRKAGWEAILLATAMTLLSRDLNVAILGFGAVILEHTMYLHSSMASGTTGQITAAPGAYQPASAPALAVAG